MLNKFILLNEKNLRASFDISTNKFYIDGPSIALYPEKNYLTLTGIILDIINVIHLKEKVIISFNFSLLNTRSILELIALLKNIKISDKCKHDINVNWLYQSDDEDMLDIGHDLAELFSEINFNFIESSECSYIKTNSLTTFTLKSSESSN